MNVSPGDHRGGRSRDSWPVDAFARHPARAQPPIFSMATRVSRHEFAGQRALIVGGSRGLGEPHAKIIAAGGGHTIITYSVGKEDAERVAAEIEGFGATCDVLQYDVRVRPHANSAN